MKKRADDKKQARPASYGQSVQEEKKAGDDNFASTHFTEQIFTNRLQEWR